MNGWPISPIADTKNKKIIDSIKSYITFAAMEDHNNTSMTSAQQYTKKLGTNHVKPLLYTD